MHAIGEQGIVDLAHPLARALLHPLDRRFGGQATVDRLVDAARPALVIGKHLIGLDDLDMLARDAELGLARHAVDLFAHLVERGIDAATFGIDVLGDRVFDDNARLMEDGKAAAHAIDQLLAAEPDRGGHLRPRTRRTRRIDQPGIGDQLGQHHGDRLQCLDLDIGIFARFAMLDGQHTHRPLTPDDRHAGKAVEPVLAGLGLVGEVGMAGGFVEI